MDEWNNERYGGDPGLPNYLHAMINHGAPDPHQLIRDAFVHWGFYHDREDRRITILDGQFPTDRVRLHHEAILMREIGGFEYFPQNGTGSLNKFL